MWKIWINWIVHCFQYSSDVTSGFKSFKIVLPNNRKLPTVNELLHLHTWNFNNKASSCPNYTELLCNSYFWILISFLVLVGDLFKCTSCFYETQREIKLSCPKFHIYWCTPFHGQICQSYLIKLDLTIDKLYETGQFVSNKEVNTSV